MYYVSHMIAWNVGDTMYLNLSFENRAGVMEFEEQPLYIIDVPIAQLAEHPPFKWKVEGSIPSWHIIK